MPADAPDHLTIILGLIGAASGTATFLSRLTITIELALTEHWQGPAPEKIIVIFGGDLISNEIHEELPKTNEALAAPAVRECIE